jgi:hypothetical protein
MSLEQLLAT